jgi:hypothetical protein
MVNFTQHVVSPFPTPVPIEFLIVGTLCKKEMSGPNSGSAFKARLHIGWAIPVTDLFLAHRTSSCARRGVLQSASKS